MSGKPVRFYFDFLSPYSYLASQVIAKTPAYREIDFRYKPVVFGSILSKLGTKGPGEIPTRRRLGLHDGIMLASMYDIPFEGPPTHPFNTIVALRSVCDVEDEAKKGELMQAYFRAAWAEGKDIETDEVLQACLAACGIEQNASDAASKRENRQALKANTRELLELGAWGVPTFVVDDLVFFGHDRLPLLRAYLDGEVDPNLPKLEEMLGRPQPGRIT